MLMRRPEVLGFTEAAQLLQSLDRPEAFMKASAQPSAVPTRNVLMTKGQESREWEPSYQQVEVYQQPRNDAYAEYDEDAWYDQSGE